MGTPVCATTLLKPNNANNYKISRKDFPPDFIIGAASSAYQVEGGAKEGGRGTSIWDTFTEKNPSVVKDGSNGNIAVNSYHLYKEDVRILKKLGLDSYRFSISWPRVLPCGTINGGINREGINYYNNLIDELLENGIKPFVTLFHWDLPQALEDKYGGFLSPEIVEDFCEYVELCFWEFGDRVKNWITVNEPRMFSVEGYLSGGMAPGRGQSSDTYSVNTIHRFGPVPQQCINSNGNPSTEPYLVGHHQLLAHAAAVDLYKTKFQRAQKGKVGITLNADWIEPLDDANESDRKATKRALDFSIGWFLEPLTTGDYPESMKRLVGLRLPKFTVEQSEKLKGSYDFLGLNYYTSIYATNASLKSRKVENMTYDTDSQVSYTSERNGIPIGPTAASAWLFIYPEGIYKLLVYIKKTYRAPLIYITENGVSEVNDSTITLSKARVDNIRIKYLYDHLSNIQRAIDDGVKVQGYFIWSLLDSFEWGTGYTVRFGLLYTDYKNKFSRYPKDSAIWLMDNFHKN
ncbi:hypothetical protein M9H77_06730 [Catharanthus roseus]|uniref:Uncharacterized protein n=1 Tax=Catharanthus roseus TaxID=4058 RepID=A0ACC0BT25_CATRO|nr:hypothetical protein M9H77_06730 [Catharanthus roseus]